MGPPSPLQDVRPGRGRHPGNVPFLTPGVRKEGQGEGRAWQSSVKWGRGWQREGPAEAPRDPRQGAAVAARAGGQWLRRCRGRVWKRRAGAGVGTRAAGVPGRGSAAGPGWASGHAGSAGPGGRACREPPGWEGASAGMLPGGLVTDCTGRGARGAGPAPRPGSAGAAAAGRGARLRGLQAVLQEHLAAPLPSPIFSSFSYFCIAAAARTPAGRGCELSGAGVAEEAAPAPPARPAHLPARGLLGRVVLGRPSFPAAPRALANETTSPSRPRSGSLQRSPPGTRVRPPRPTLDFKSQQASRVRLPTPGVALRLPGCPALVVIIIFFCDHRLLGQRASLRLHVPECSRRGGGAPCGVWGLAAPL